MKRQFSIAALFCLGAALLSAQDLVITNARIIVGSGAVINSGSIVVRGGKIVSASAGPASAAGVKTIDAKGMSVMPGFIDGHRHINTGPNEKVQMQQLLEAGYTTILSGGGPAEGNITLRDHIDKGVINGPRIIPSGSIRLNNNTPEKAREEVRKMAAMGIKFTGEIALTPKPGPTPEEMEILRAIVDESKKVGVLVQVHAVSPRCHDGRRRRRRPPAGSYPALRLADHGRSQTSLRRRHQAIVDDRLRRPRLRRFRRRQQTAFPRRQAVARVHPRRRRPRPGSRLQSRERPHLLGCRSHLRLRHRHQLRSPRRSRPGIEKL